MSFGRQDFAGAGTAMRTYHAAALQEIDDPRGVVVANSHALLQHRDGRTVRLDHDRLRPLVFLLAHIAVNARRSIPSSSLACSS